MYCKILETKDLDFNKPIFFDTETIGLYGRTRLFQVRQDITAYEYDCYYINIEDIKRTFQDAHLVGHNVIYDLSCKNLRGWLPKQIDDTLLLARLAFPECQEYSLAKLAMFLKLPNKTNEAKSDWGAYALTQEQLAYASNDTLLVELLHMRIPKHIYATQSYRLDIENLKLALVYQNRGMPTNAKEIARLKREYTKQLASLDLPQGLNVNSPKQVSEFLGTSSADSATLSQLNTLPALNIATARHCYKILQFLEVYGSHNTIYSFFNPNGAKTGRFTSKAGALQEDSAYVNLQQVPRELKSCFATKAPAMFVTADYPALELWIMAALTGDSFLVEALSQKRDLHTETAQRLFGKQNINKEERTTAKTCNFALLYGAGYKRLAEALLDNGLRNLANDAQRLRMQWLSVFTGIAQEHKRIFDIFNDGVDGVRVKTPLGREIYATKPTEALNFSVQGGGAECTKLALYLLNKNKIPITSTVHDSIALIASNDKEVKEFSEALKYAMEEAFIRVTRNCKCSILHPSVDVYVGENYN